MTPKVSISSRASVTACCFCSVVSPEVPLSKALASAIALLNFISTLSTVRSLISWGVSGGIGGFKVSACPIVTEASLSWLVTVLTPPLPPW